MVRKARLKNVGETQAETPEAEASEQVGGFAPSVEAQIAADASHSQGDEANAEGATEQVEVDAQTEEDLENVGANVDPKSDKSRRTVLMRKVAEVGKAYGGGKVSMIALAEMVTEGAAAGLLSFNDQRKKGAPKKSDAQEVYERFRANADAKATIDGGLVPDSVLTGKGGDEAKASKQQVAKLNSFIKLGNTFRDDASDLVARVRSIHIKLLGDEAERKGLKPGSTYTMMYSIAAKHVDPAELKANPSKTVWDDERIGDFLRVGKETKEPTAADKLLSAIRAATEARDGSTVTGRESAVETDLINHAIDVLRQAVATETDGAAKLGEFDAKHAKASNGNGQATAPAQTGAAQPVGAGETEVSDDEASVEAE